MAARIGYPADGIKRLFRKASRPEPRFGGESRRHRGGLRPGFHTISALNWPLVPRIGAVASCGQLEPAIEVENSQMPQRIDLEAERSFIGAWFIDNPAVCDDLIEFYRKSPDKLRSVSVDINGRPRNVPGEKDSEELCIDPGATIPAFQTYLTELQKCVAAYIELYPYCNMFAPWTIVQMVNVQHYAPGGGYKIFHTERVSSDPYNSNRHLAFMTYLNDVTDGGGTEFLYQRSVVSARRGLTLIWPVDWTHTHRGIVSPTQEKYIITGWFNFV